MSGVTQLCNDHYRSLVRLAALLVRDRALAYLKQAVVTPVL
jgi:hypothetical protein